VLKVGVTPHHKKTGTGNTSRLPAKKKKEKKKEKRKRKKKKNWDSNISSL